MNRILLLLGYQPTYSEVSTEVIIGQICKGGKPDGHLRLFTFRALMELLEYHGFKVIKVAGSGSLYQPRIIKFLDKMFAKRPSFARIQIIACIKPHTLLKI